MAKTQATILVVEDEEKILDVVVPYPEKSGYRVCRAVCGRQVPDAFHTEETDCMIPELMLPDLTGEVVCKT
jgi:DNA-binding response OmpR family regulator